MDEHQLTGADVLIVAILVLWLGNLITNRVPLLKKYSIPLAVTGGLICSILVVIIDSAGGPKITFDMRTRDILLLVFFSTIGLSAKFSRLAAGGKALGILVACAAVFLVVQNVTGVLLSMAFGNHPGLGLFAGSVSLAGGHGTAIAWGEEAAAAGIEGAALAGIAFATFGLVAGGVIGGPLAERLITKNNLKPSENASESSDAANEGSDSDGKTGFSLEGAFTVLLVLAICVSLGDVVNRYLFERDFKVPGFLTAMLVGIGITNLSDKMKRPLDQSAFGNMGEICLQLFLAMSLMSMDLSSVAGAFGPIFVVLTIQILVISIFAVYIIFRVMGRNYDAAVIAGGFCGLGMGATPVAIANMNAVTLKHGPSFKAFLVIPLVGAFFVDILNAIIIKFFLGLPIMQRASEVAVG